MRLLVWSMFGPEVGTESRSVSAFATRNKKQVLVVVFFWGRLGLLLLLFVYVGMPSFWLIFAHVGENVPWVREGGQDPIPQQARNNFFFYRLILFLCLSFPFIWRVEEGWPIHSPPLSSFSRVDVQPVSCTKSSGQVQYRYCSVSGIKPSGINKDKKK